MEHRSLGRHGSSSGSRRVCIAIEIRSSAWAGRDGLGMPDPGRGVVSAYQSSRFGPCFEIVSTGGRHGSSDLDGTAALMPAKPRRRSARHLGPGHHEPRAELIARHRKRLLAQSPSGIGQAWTLVAAPRQGSPWHRWSPRIQHAEVRAAPDPSRNSEHGGRRMRPRPIAGRLRAPQNEPQQSQHRPSTLHYSISANAGPGGWRASATGGHGE